MKKMILIQIMKLIMLSMYRVNYKRILKVKVLIILLKNKVAILLQIVKKIIQIITLKI